MRDRVTSEKTVCAEDAYNSTAFGLLVALETLFQSFGSSVDSFRPVELVIGFVDFGRRRLFRVFFAGFGAKSAFAGVAAFV